MKTKEELKRMGNLIKLNMYAEIKRKKDKKLKVKNFEEITSKYNNWLKKTSREDKIESYEEFLQVQ